MKNKVRAFYSVRALDSGTMSLLYCAAVALGYTGWPWIRLLTAGDGRHHSDLGLVGQKLPSACNSTTSTRLGVCGGGGGGDVIFK